MSPGDFENKTATEYALSLSEPGVPHSLVCDMSQGNHSAEKQYYPYFVKEMTSDDLRHASANISFNGAVFIAARHTSIYSQHCANVIPKKIMRQHDQYSRVAGQSSS